MQDNQKTRNIIVHSLNLLGLIGSTIAIVFNIWVSYVTPRPSWWAWMIIVFGVLLLVSSEILLVAGRRRTARFLMVSGGLIMLPEALPSIIAGVLDGILSPIMLGGKSDELCQNCGYCLRGLKDPRCPECGCAKGFRKSLEALLEDH